MKRSTQQSVPTGTKKQKREELLPLSVSDFFQDASTLLLYNDGENNNAAPPQSKPPTTAPPPIREWFELAKVKKVRILRSTLTGCLLLEFRKFEDDGVTPSEIGIYLDESQIRLLCTLLPALEQTYESILSTDENVKFSQEIGNGIYVTLDSNFLCLDLRKFFTLRKKEGSEEVIQQRQPSKKKGMAFNLAQVKLLRKFLHDDVEPELKPKLQRQNAVVGK